MTGQKSKAGVGRDAVYRFMLFVAGDEPNSRAARTNLASLCEHDLHGRARVDIVDVLEEIETAAKHNILVTPTLLVMEPRPAVTIVGNLSDRMKLHAALRLGGN